MNTELKPCPFCNGEAAHSELSFDDALDLENDPRLGINPMFRHKVICTGECSASTGYWANKEAATKAWHWRGEALWD